uniref:Uncharacterized protein n=1 Tax=Romanomermis culicivorax TaxID=13658 RepID=A0A915JBY4_ROMCU
MNNGTDGNSIGRILVPVVSGGIFYTCGVARKWKWVPRRCYLNMHNGIKGHYSFYVLFRDMKKQLPMDGPNDPLWSIYGNTCDPKSFLVCACESMIRYVSRLQDNKIKVESSFAANDTIIQGPTHQLRYKLQMRALEIRRVLLYYF